LLNFVPASASYYILAYDMQHRGEHEVTNYLYAHEYSVLQRVVSSRRRAPRRQRHDMYQSGYIVVVYSCCARHWSI